MAYSADQSSDYVGSIEFKEQKAGLFNKDAASFTLFSTITDRRTKKSVEHCVEKIADFSKKHTSLLGQGSHMTYDELLMGMFLEDEQLVPVRPLMITNYRMCDAETVGWPVEDEKFGLRLFLTNKRIFFLDADLEEITRLERVKEKGDVFLVDRLSVDLMVVDELFYFPVPLTNVTGLSLDIHYQTMASGSIEEKRPWWASICCCGGAFVALIATLEALVIWDRLARLENCGDECLLVPVEEEDLGGGSAAAAVVEEEPFILPLGIDMGLDVNTWSAFVGGYGALILGPLLFLFWRVFSRSEFVPRMKQRRQILIGARDPVTQKQKAFKLLLDDRYETVQIRDYLHLLQEYSPTASGIVLKD